MQTATDKKIDFLNDLEGTDIDSSVYPELERLSRDRNPEIRNRVAQVLDGACGEYTDILLRLLNDRDELVRVNACDSLSGTDSREAINGLEKHISDSSELVREYVYSSLYDTASMNPTAYKSEVRALLLPACKDEKSDRAGAVLACSLYALDEADAVNKIKSYISSEDCYVRNAAVQQLHAICGDVDISCFRKDLQAQYRKESVGFVKDALESLLEDIPTQCSKKGRRLSKKVSLSTTMISN